VLDDSDAVTNLVPPIHPIPSTAPTAPGSASATTMRPTTPPIHPIPSAAPTAPGSAPTTTTPTTTTPTTTTPTTTTPTTTTPTTTTPTTTTPEPLTDHNVACHLDHDNHDPQNPGAAPTAPGPTTPATAHHSPRRIPRRNSGRPRTTFNEPRCRVGAQRRARLNAGSVSGRPSPNPACAFRYAPGSP
jgi:hypothetical protein